MDDAKQQLADRLKTANNILVTVSRDPSVDQLSALLGLTLLLTKQGKHAAAVFSGQVPSTIEFLQPDETIEKNTDSLRDFIIALDKNKADKLRYKVEDNVVRIFITPYRTSISQEDFEFSQGDFNVDVVVAVGVRQQEDLDEAITAHGRILHDATVASINISPDAGLGTINWSDPQASSLSELVTELAQTLDAKLLDEQIATALLTGIVSETERFSNDKTSSQTMSMSALLMSAGANQQLVASKLEEPLQPGQPDSDNDDDDQAYKNDFSDDGPLASGDGTIEIDHNDSAASTDDDDADTDESADAGTAFKLPTPSEDQAEDTDIDIDASGKVNPLNSSLPEPPPSEPEPPQTSTLSPGADLVTEPPTLGGTLTANSTTQDGVGPTTDPLSMPASEPDQLLSREPGAGTLPASPALPPEPADTPSEPALAGMTPPPPAWVPAAPAAPAPTPVVMPVSDPDIAIPSDPTLTDLEQAIDNPPVNTEPSPPPADVEDARDEVEQALNDPASSAAVTQPPLESLNAQALGTDLHPPSTDVSVVTSDTSVDPSVIVGPADPSVTSQTPQVIDPTAPPPVPPPIPFQFGNPPPAQ